MAKKEKPKANARERASTNCKQRRRHDVDNTLSLTHTHTHTPSHLLITRSKMCSRICDTDMIMIFIWFYFDFFFVSSFFAFLLATSYSAPTLYSLLSLSLSFPLCLTCFVAAVDLLALCSSFLLLLAYFSHACGLWFAFACAVVLCLVLPICACREGGRVEESERERETERAALHRRHCCCWLTRWRISRLDETHKFACTCFYR